MSDAKSVQSAINKRDRLEEATWNFSGGKEAYSATRLADLRKQWVAQTTKDQELFAQLKAARAGFQTVQDLAIDMVRTKQNAAAKADKKHKKAADKEVEDAKTEANKRRVATRQLGVDIGRVDPKNLDDPGNYLKILSDLEKFKRK